MPNRTLTQDDIYPVCPGCSELSSSGRDIRHMPPLCRTTEQIHAGVPVEPDTRPDAPRMYGLEDGELARVDAISDKLHGLFKPAADAAFQRLAEEFGEKMRGYTENDMPAELYDAVRAIILYRVRQIMVSLLCGAADAGHAEAKGWITDIDFAQFRQDVYDANRESIQNQLIDDLRTENKRLAARLEACNQRFGY